MIDLVVLRDLIDKVRSLLLFGQNYTQIALG